VSSRDPAKDYAAYRDIEGPSDAEVAALWAGLNARIDSGDLGPSLADERPARRFSGHLAVGALAAAVVIAVLASLRPEERAAAPPAPISPLNATFDASISRTERPLQPGTASQRLRRSPPTRPSPRAEAPPSPEPSVVAPTEDPHPHPRPRRREPSGRAEQGELRVEPPSFSPIREEVRALEDVRRSLSAGRPAEALVRLQSYDHTFVGGVLGPERDVLEIRALCGAGRNEEAARRVEALRARGDGPAWISTLPTECQKASHANDNLGSPKTTLQ